MLANGDVAVALYNKGDSAMPHQPPIPTGPCTKWTETQHGYYEAAGGPGGNVGTFSGKTVAEAKAACCANPKCVTKPCSSLSRLCCAAAVSLTRVLTRAVALRRRL